jgi:hypothetical protein
MVLLAIRTTSRRREAPARKTGDAEDGR